MPKRSKAYLAGMQRAEEALKQAANNLASPSKPNPFPSRMDFLFSSNQYEVAEPRETPKPYSVQTAPTISPDNKRTPRAEKIAYSPGKEQLVVKFYKGPWWYYNNVSKEMWDDLKSTSSTGGWLHENGLNSWDDMGQFDPSEMTRENRVMFNS